MTDSPRQIFYQKNRTHDLHIHLRVAFGRCFAVHLSQVGAIPNRRTLKQAAVHLLTSLCQGLLFHQIQF
jgi:hypothetical protein